MSDYGKKQYYIGIVGLILMIVGLWYNHKTLSLQEQESKFKIDAGKTPKLNPPIETVPRLNKTEPPISKTNPPNTDNKHKSSPSKKVENSIINYGNKQINLNLGSRSFKEIVKILDDSENIIPIPSRSNNGNIALIVSANTKSVTIYFNDGHKEFYETD